MKKPSFKNPIKLYAVMHGMFDDKKSISVKDLEILAKHFHTTMYNVMYQIRYGK